MPWHVTLLAHGTISVFATVADWYWSGEENRFKRKQWLYGHNYKRQLWTLFGLEMVQNAIYMFTGSPMWRSEALLTGLEVPVDLVGVKVGEGIVHVLDNWFGIKPKGHRAKQLDREQEEAPRARVSLETPGSRPLASPVPPDLRRLKQPEPASEVVIERSYNGSEPEMAEHEPQGSSGQTAARPDYRRKGEQVGEQVVHSVEGFVKGVTSKLRSKKKQKKKGDAGDDDRRKDVLRELDKY